MPRATSAIVIDIKTKDRRVPPPAPAVYRAPFVQKAARLWAIAPVAAIALEGLIESLLQKHDTEGWQPSSRPAADLQTKLSELVTLRPAAAEVIERFIDDLITETRARVRGWVDDMLAEDDEEGGA